MSDDAEFQRVLAEIRASYPEEAFRVNGNTLCEECGKPYWKHPLEPNVLSYDDSPFLHRICGGWLAKL